MASLRRIEHLARAGGADRGVRRDLGPGSAIGAVNDVEARRGRRDGAASLDPVDARQWQWFALQAILPKKTSFINFPSLGSWCTIAATRGR